jgi:uncharacterized phage protein gp47/JayE
VVYGNGATLSSGDKTTILNSITPLTLANLQTHVIDPTITTVAVTATVKKLAGYDSTALNTAITTAIQNYLSPMTWDWSGTVRRNELITLISNVPGVDYVTTLTAPAADVTLTGNGTLAQAGTVTITVT